jgi:hypothetical protein
MTVMSYKDTVKQMTTLKETLAQECQLNILRAGLYNITSRAPLNYRVKDEF